MPQLGAALPAHCWAGGLTPACAWWASLLPAATIHPHGVAYLKSSEGSPYFDGTMGERAVNAC